MQHCSFFYSGLSVLPDEPVILSLCHPTFLSRVSPLQIRHPRTPYLTLPNDNSLDDKDSRAMTIRFQQGNLTNKDVFGDCNVMFNPSNTGLGIASAGGAEGAIKNAVGEGAFNKANKALLNNKGCVDDGLSSSKTLSSSPVKNTCA
jgi:hypothetical protein